MKDHLEVMKEELQNGRAQLLDVREQQEWNAGHLVEARLACLSELQVGIEPDDADLNKKTYLHCRSGVRVLTAAPILEGMGFREVIPLGEGFSELVTLGFDME